MKKQIYGCRHGETELVQDGSPLDLGLNSYGRDGILDGMTTPASRTYHGASILADHAIAGLQ